MFKFNDEGMYQMPVHFGPCCGPRRAPDGERFYRRGAQDSTQHMLVYETDSEAVEQFLPEGFSVRKPYIIVTHKMHRNLPWLAGHGYNVTTFNVPVFYKGKRESICGLYQLAIWENHADPIICGREQLGYSKIYAEITDVGESGSASLSSWGFTFLELKFDMSGQQEMDELLKSILFDPENEGLMHYKYVPHSQADFNQADAAYVVLTPAGFKLPEAEEIPALPAPQRSYGTGEIKWHIPQWEDMPTQYHVVQGLASLPIVKIIGAQKVTLKHYNDVYHQRVVE